MPVDDAIELHVACRPTILLSGATCVSRRTISDDGLECQSTRESTSPSSYVKYGLEVEPLRIDETSPGADLTFVVDPLLCDEASSRTSQFMGGWKGTSAAVTEACRPAALSVFGTCSLLCARRCARNPKSDLCRIFWLGLATVSSAPETVSSVLDTLPEEAGSVVSARCGATTGLVGAFSGTGGARLGDREGRGESTVFDLGLIDRGAHPLTGSV